MSYRASSRGFPGVRDALDACTTNILTPKRPVPLAQRVEEPRVDERQQRRDADQTISPPRLPPPDLACRLRRLLGRLRRRDGVHDSKIIVHPESIENEAQSLDSWRFTASSFGNAFYQCYRVSASTVCACVDLKDQKPSLIGTKVARDAAQHRRPQNRASGV